MQANDQSSEQINSPQPKKLLNQTKNFIISDSYRLHFHETYNGFFKFIICEKDLTKIHQCSNIFYNQDYSELLLDNDQLYNITMLSYGILIQKLPFYDLADEFDKIQRLKSDYITNGVINKVWVLTSFSALIFAIMGKGTILNRPLGWFFSGLFSLASLKSIFDNHMLKKQINKDIENFKYGELFNKELNKDQIIAIHDLIDQDIVMNYSQKIVLTDTQLLQVILYLQDLINSYNIVRTDELLYVDYTPFTKKLTKTPYKKHDNNIYDIKKPID